MIRPRTNTIARKALAVLFLLQSWVAPDSAQGRRGSELPRVIFTQAQMDRLAQSGAMLFEITGPFWTPTESQVRDLEQRLPDFLKASTEPRANLIQPKLAGYKRQYFGFTIVGTRQILLNAFCDAGGPKDYWRSQVVFVLDGGECYFQVSYDPATKSFTSFSINGEA
jgi:hypothetical protein